MNKHLLSTIAAAMLPIGMSSASIQSAGAYSYVGSRNNKNTTYATSSHASNIGNNHARQRTNENPLALNVNESAYKSADKLTAASLQQTLMTDSELTLSTVNNRTNNNHIENNQSTTSHQDNQMAVPNSQPSLQMIAQSNVSELIIIDAAVPDKHVFYQQLKPGVEVKEIDSEQDGLLQLNEILSNYQHLNALHIVSHGDDGVIYLGNTQVNEQLLKDKVETFSALNNALKEDADLLLYGCNVAKTAKGESLLALIANESHIDVAASNNLTGNVVNHSDWNLEITQGEINTRSPFSTHSLQDFSEVLAITDSSGGTITFNAVPIADYSYHASVTYTNVLGSNFNLVIAVPGGAGDEVGGGGSSQDYINVDAYGAQDVFKVHFYFSGGETFDASSISIKNVTGDTNTFTISSDQGDSQSNNIPSVGTLATPVSLSGFTGITRLTIVSSDATFLGTLAFDDFIIANVTAPPNVDGNVTSAANVAEPVGIDSTVNEASEAVDVFDFTITDGGASDGLSLDVTQVNINVSGTSTDALRDDVTWRLSGPDLTNEVGTYNATTDTISFSSLNISVADGTSEIYTVNAYMNTSNAVTDNSTFILTVDGDTDLTVASSGTQMATTSDVSNGSGGAFNVEASELTFTTQPVGSVSGVALTTQPVVTAVDEFGNTDLDFTETITITEASAGTLTGGSVAAASGVATFTALKYKATIDKQSVTFTVNDEDGIGTNLAAVAGSPLVSDVVATKLTFSTQPAGSVSGVALTTQPVVSAVDADDVVDTDFTETITLTENGLGSITGDSFAAISGVATFTALTYTATADNQSFTLTANDQDAVDTNLAGINASVITSTFPPNATPMITNTAPSTATEGVAYSFTPIVSDADSGDTFSFSSTALPLWASLNTSTGVLSGTPNNDNVGSSGPYNITVTDAGGASSTLTIASINVINVNNAPVISGTPTTTVAQDALYSFTPSTVDPDSGDTLTYSVTGSPSWAVFTPSAGTLAGTPTSSDVGTTSNIVITVTDAGGLSDDLAAFSIEVTNVNDAPVISGTPATTAPEGSLYSFTPTVTDLDSGDTKTFAINKLPTWATFNEVNGKLSGTPTSSNAGDITSGIIITVSDSLFATDTLGPFSIEVTDVNNAPVISGTPLTTVEQGAVYSFTPTVTDVDSGETTIFSITTKPTWAEFDTDTGTLSGTPSSDDVGITTDIIITVADKDNATASLAAFSIEVVNPEASIEAVDDTYEFNRNADNTYVLNVLDNDIAESDSELTLTESSTSIGSVVIESNQLVLTVDDGFVGAVELNYSISNSNKKFSEASVSVVITGDTDSLNVITAPNDIEVNATGLYTAVDLGVATATNASGNAIAVNLVGTTLFTPGNHIAYWETTVDDAESNVTVSQQVVVHPLVSLSKDQVVLEGAEASVRVLLNGDAPVYPLTIPFDVSGSVSADDYVINVNSVDVESGTEAVITISIVDDGVAETDETLTITLGDVNKGSQFVHTMTITEGNIAPSIELSLSQNNELRQVITPVDGLVTITASVDDINGDLTTTAWSYDSSFVIDEETSQLVFDPNTLAAGTYSVSLSVTDDNVNPLSSTKPIYFSVVSDLSVLTTADTDGDLIPDNQEGYTDSDSDGIPDYLDAISECNVVPQQVVDQNAYLVEGDAGICLRLGNTIVDGETGGLQLTESELAAFTGESDSVSNVGGIFDYIATGLPVNGQDYQIVLPQRQPIPADALYRKYNTASGWTSFVEDADNQLHSAAGQAGYCPPPSSDLWTAGLTEGHWCVQLTIVDGGPNDDDGEANGTIVDPGGVGIVASDNTAPTAVNDLVNVKSGESIIINVLANDVDAEADELTLGVVTASLGVVSITSDNQVDYQTPTDFIGVDVVTYTVSDGQGGTASATVNINVFINEAPIAIADNASTDDRTAITINVLTNDTDADNDVLSVLSASVDFGHVVVNSDSSLTYTPELGFDGIAIISYEVTDNVNNPVLGAVSIVVTALEAVIVENESKGGNMGVMTLFMLALAAFRAKSRLNVKARSTSLLAVVVGLFSFNASANESEGWFASGAVGKNTVIEQIDTSNVSNVASVSFDDSDTSFHFGVGYKFTDYSITLGYELLGDTNASITGYTSDIAQYQEAVLEAAPILVDGLSLGGQYNVWRNDMFTVSAGLGILIWDLDYESRVQDDVVLVDDSGVDFFYKLQVGYQINDKVAINLQATRYDISYNDVNNIAVGVAYQF